MTNWETLKEYIGKDSFEDDEFIQSCWSVASILTTQAFANAWRAVPQDVLDRVALEVGNELYNRRNSPSGASQYATFDGGTQPIRGPRDPLSQVRPLINAYVVPF